MCIVVYVPRAATTSIVCVRDGVRGCFGDVLDELVWVMLGCDVTWRSERAMMVCASSARVYGLGAEMSWSGLAYLAVPDCRSKVRIVL